MATDTTLRTTPRGRIPPKTVVWLLNAAALIVALLASSRLLARALPRYLPRDWSLAHEFDALVDWKGARLFLHGKSPFTPEGLTELAVPGFGHPPTAPFWFLPLAGFEKGLAAELLSLSVVVCLVIHVTICVKELRFPAPVAVTTFLCSALLMTDALLVHFTYIQLSEYIALANVIAWRQLRRGKSLSAGIAVGVGTTMKLFPGLLIVLFLFTRRWKALVAWALTFLTVAAIMTAGFGVQAWLSFFGKHDRILNDWLGHIRNASLQGVVHRFFHPICDGHAVPTKASVGVALGIGLSLVVLAVVISWKDFRRAREVDPTAIDLPFALFSVLSAFLTAWAWEHYVVILIQPALVVAASLSRTFGTTLRAWLDERASHRKLAYETLMLVVGFVPLVAGAVMLGVNWAAKERFLGLWYTSKEPYLHRMLHFYETVNYLPWVLMIALCFFCLGRARLSTAPGFVEGTRSG